MFTNFPRLLVGGLGLRCLLEEVVESLVVNLARWEVIEEGAIEEETGSGFGDTAGAAFTENKRSSGSGEAGRWKVDFPVMNISISLCEGSC